MRMQKLMNKMVPVFSVALMFSASVFMQGCGGSDSDKSNTAVSVDDSTGGTQDSITEVDSSTEGSNASGAVSVDITNAIFAERSVDCADYSNTFEASVLDITNSTGFDAAVLISHTDSACAIVSNSIPNHDFNDHTASFASDVAEVGLSFSISRSPQMATSTTALSQMTTNGIFLNGVVLDILSAGCYAPSSRDAGSDGNTHIGCRDDAAWLLDPLGTSHKFGADAHNAHVQPGGQYHYHGNPNAMFDDHPGPNGSPVIGFAADGYPIYGSYFYDKESGEVRKAVSGYTLKAGNRVAIDGLNPSDNAQNSAVYDGTYVADWEFTNAGDLDECNGMTVDGQYGYYTIDSYPWVMACFKGTPDVSFYKGGSIPGGEGMPPAGIGMPVPGA